MTALFAFPPASSDSLFASESPFASENQLRSPKQHCFIQLEKLSIFRKLSDLMPILALCTALCDMVCASMFVVIAEQELSPIATVFDRLLDATVGFGIWSLLQLLTRQHPEIVQHEAILHTDILILIVGSRDRSNSDSS